MGTTADVTRVAGGEIGYRERGENDTKYNRWLGSISGYGSGGYGYPWCASFASWVFAQAGLRAGEDFPKTASCLAGVTWYKNQKRWTSVPHVGDQVFYGANGGTHTEIVVAVSSSTITTIGGNTGGSLNGTYHNGDGVYRKTINRNEPRIYGYGRPVYTMEDEVKSQDIAAIAAAVVGKAYNVRGHTVGQALQMSRDGIEVLLVRSEANAAAVATLTQAVAALAKNQHEIDVDALVARIRAEINKVTIKLVSQ